MPDGSSSFHSLVIDVDLISSIQINTTLGCKLSLDCYGAGTAIGWKKNNRRDIVNNGLVNMTTYSSGQTWYANVKFTYLTQDDSGRYTCEISTGTTSQTFGIIQLIVNSTPIRIEPLPTINLATYTVGDILTIDCAVVTCAPAVTLKMSPGIAQQNIITYTNTLSRSVQTFSLKVTPTIVGTYSITAQGVFFNGFTSLTSLTTQTFSITGTPRSFG
eukprot:Em0009g443a